MGIQNTSTTGRREFLSKASAAGGVLGLTALAGCAGDEDESEDDGNGNSNGGMEASDPEDLGEPLPTYTYLNNAQSYNPPRHDGINLIADRLDELGFDMEVEVLEWGTLFNRVSVEYEYDFATWHTFFTIDPVLELNSTLYSENTGPGDGNYSGYENADVDALIDDAMAESDPGAREEIVHDLQHELMGDVPQMPIVHMPAPAVYNNEQTSNWVANIVGFNSYYTMINLEMEGGEDTLKGYWPETLSTMNVLGHNDENKHVYQFNVMYDKLVQFNDEFVADPEISLATDWERVDETTMEYTIRDHSFHDGEPLTVEDVAFTYNYIVEHEVPLYSVQANYIEGAEVVDDDTVQINLSQELGPFNVIVASQIPILPEHQWADRDNPSEQNIEEPVGSGPLEFDYWEQGSEFGLERFDDHFAPVDFEKRFWRIIPESSTVWEMLRNGDLNYEPFGRIDRNLDENQDHENIGTEFNQATSYWHFTPNQRTAGLDDPTVRKAAVNAIPRTPIVEQILFGFPDPGVSVVSEAFGTLHADDVPKYEEDIEVGQQRLEDEGFGWNEDGNLHFPAE